MTTLEIAIQALEEIADSDYSFEGHACLHCEVAMEAINKIKREMLLFPEVESENKRPKQKNWAVPHPGRVQRNERGGV